jgi:hypothetical protein
MMLRRDRTLSTLSLTVLGRTVGNWSMISSLVMGLPEVACNSTHPMTSFAYSLWRGEKILGIVLLFWLVHVSVSSTT